MWKMYNEIVEENKSNETDKDELETRTSEPLVPFGRYSAFQWWAENRLASSTWHPVLKST